MFKEMKDEIKKEVQENLDKDLYFKKNADKLKTWEYKNNDSILEFQIVNDEIYFIFSEHTIIEFDK